MANELAKLKVAPATARLHVQRAAGGDRYQSCPQAGDGFIGAAAHQDLAAVDECSARVVLVAVVMRPDYRSPFSPVQPVR